MKILPLAAVAFFGAVTISFGSDLVLWYQQPAVVTRSSPLINEALPIGNGHIGGLIAGGTAREQVVLDEDSLWLGGDNPSGDDNTMGSYQMLGSLFINLPGHENATDYRRDLDIGDALAHVRYSVNGVKFSREYFCSHADGVLVVRLTADKPGSYTGSIELTDSHRATIVADKNRLTDAGALNNGLKYEAQLVAVHAGGSLQANGSALAFTNCDSLTLVIAAGTDYAMDYAKNIAAKTRTRASRNRLTTQRRRSMTRSRPRMKRIFIRSSTALHSTSGNLPPDKLRCPPTSAKSKPPGPLTRSLRNCFSNMAAIC